MRWCRWPAALAGCLDRLAGYSERYEAALARARAGEREWVDGLGRDSCHTVWFQLHEDLLATLGIPAGTSRAEDPCPAAYDGGWSHHDDRHPDERRDPRRAEA